MGLLYDIEMDFKSFNFFPDIDIQGWEIYFSIG